MDEGSVYPHVTFAKTNVTEMLKAMRKPPRVKFPQIVLLHGTDDVVVPPSQSQDCAAAWQERADRMECILIPKQDHTQFIDAWMLDGCNYDNPFLAAMQRTGLGH